MKHDKVKLETTNHPHYKGIQECQSATLTVCWQAYLSFVPTHRLVWAVLPELAEEPFVGAHRAYLQVGGVSRNVFFHHEFHEFHESFSRDVMHVYTYCSETRSWCLC